MPYIFIEGGGKRQRELTTEAAAFAASKLFPKTKNYNININLGSDKNDCFELDDREYEININKNVSKDDFITAIFHEMVHVKQYIKNEMKDYNYKNWFEYISLPVEKEAYKLQEVLLKQWNGIIMKTPKLKFLEENFLNRKKKFDY